MRHCADTKESGQQEREKEWTGGTNHSDKNMKIFRNYSIINLPSIDDYRDIKFPDELSFHHQKNKTFNWGWSYE